jgi:sensor c-di-GMP phosphodiesterase-like protein
MILRQLGFYNIQDFYFSKSIPHDEFLAFVEHNETVGTSGNSDRAYNALF